MENQVYYSLGKHSVRFGGKSSWSKLTEPKDIEVHIVVDYVFAPEDDYQYASIFAFFDSDQWDVEKHGDIYTDPSFKEGIKSIITEHGYSNLFGYSESGMQGDSYVHFDLAVNDKLEEDSIDGGNYDIDWVTIRNKSKLKSLKLEIEYMKNDIKEKIALVEQMEIK